MEDQTQTFVAQPAVTNPKPVDNNESKFANISIRGWLAVGVIGTVCAMALMGRDVKEPLYTLAAMVAGVYFAQQKPQIMPPKQ